MIDQQLSVQHPWDEDGNRILIVDDHIENVHLLAHILQQNGYAVETATEGAQALASAQTSPPSLILLDVMMPGMDGFEVCKRLKAEESTQDLPVIFISALGAWTEKVKGFEAGGVDYVSKPFHAKEVLARIKTHLALRRLHQQLEARNAELQQRNADLEQALDTIQTLSGLIPICAWCGRKIQDEEGKWVTVETYIEAHSTASFTHGMCPACLQKAKADAAEMLPHRDGRNLVR